jgi:transcriptional regulator with AAA-type ATPase domain/tetratricopeptide (TPR) repeat protein
MMDAGQRATDFDHREDGADLRSEDLERLLTALDAPHGRPVVLHGRRGVGKQRLVRELVRRGAERAQVVVLEGHTPEAGGRSFHPFAEVAHQAMACAGQAGLTEQVVDPVYEALFPVLDHGHAEIEGPSLDQKLRFFDALRRLLAGLGSQARLLVIIHDLERADSDTLELATYLVDELFGEPDLDPQPAVKGLMVLVARDDAPHPGARDVLAELMERPGLQRLHLEGLDLEGLRRYVQSPHVLEKLLAASAGLPQEVDALIEALPDNVEELFERKLSGMEAVSRDALRALALSGRPASPRTLATVVQHPLREVARALNALRDERVVDRKIHNGEFQFLFHRRRDLEVTERTLSAEDRARYHGGWAQALTGAPDSGGPALLAHHQLRSQEPQRGVSLAIQAAETYAVSGALNAAIEMLESARPYAQGELLLAILERLAELAPLTGNPRRALRFVEAMKAALPEGQRGVAHLKEAELRNAAGEYELALVSLDAARASLAPDDARARARVEAAVSEAHYHRAELGDAAHAAREGLEILSAKGEGPVRERIELMNQLGKIALADDDTAHAIDFFQETLALAEKSGLGHEQARALVNLGMAHMRLGETSRAEQRLLAGIEKAQEVNDLTRLAFGYMNLGVLVHQCGELGRALECYRECRSLFRRLGNRTQLARVLHNLGNLYLLVGDLERARAHNDEAMRLARQSGVERVVAISTVVDGILIGALGEHEAGERRLREGMRLLRRMGQARPLEAMVELVELKLEAGETEAAAELLTEVEAGLAQVPSPILRARAHLLAGQVALDQGRDAEAAFTQARDAFERLGRRLFVRDAEVGLTRALTRAGRREAARLHLDAAREIQQQVAEDLPEHLAQRFWEAAPQVALREAQDELEGRPAPAAAPVPSAAWVEASAPSAPAAPVAHLERKPEWQEKYGAIVGSSNKLFRVFHILDRIAQSDGTVLINGESGTGKELVAEAIHRNSPRANGPFVKLNCAALVESLLLSELFGHERGSFTGAHQRKIGRFEMAAGGTLFLDEIGDISPKTQVALLRVLQEREFERVGGGRPIKVEARIIFATNRNLQEMVREGTFREDLYYRLKGLTIDLPPLRDRPDDIVTLAEHFLGQYAQESGSVAKGLALEAMELLSRYEWPGNIRELENIIRSVALFAEGAVITGRDFDEYRELFQDGPVLTSASRPAPPAPASALPERAPEPRRALEAAPPPAQEPRNPTYSAPAPVREVPAWGGRPRGRASGRAGGRSRGNHALGPGGRPAPPDLHPRGSPPRAQETHPEPSNRSRAPNH